MNKIFIFFSKYYKYLIFIFIISCLSGASYLYFQDLSKNQIKKDGINYIDFVLKTSENQNQEITQDEYSSLKMIENSKNSFGVLAKLTIAQDLLAKADFDLAKTKLSEIFENKTNDKIIKDYAFLLFSQILVSQKKYEEFDKILDEKKFLKENNEFVFKENLFELAILSSIKQNKNEKLNDLIDLIKQNKEKFSGTNTFLERINQFEVSMKYHKIQ